MLNLLARVIAFIIYPFVRGRVLAEARALAAVASQRQDADRAAAEAREQRQRDEEALLRHQLDQQVVDAHATKSRFADGRHDVVLRFASGRTLLLVRTVDGNWVYPGVSGYGHKVRDAALINMCEIAVFESQNKIKVLPTTDAPASEAEAEAEDEDTA